MQRLLLLAILLAIAGTTASGQTATILGTVTDPSGAAVPGASVKVTNTATKVTRDLGTNTSGSYIAPELQIGPYLLRVELKGFKSSERTGIVLNSNDTVRM